ncbi:hypothetical protein BCR32DRAFT_283931 [Anaeromyces robustus]|uniref:Uncharacterized protein n=1 Tax=Anaeromyces robustus TaxID=1754192 RepID=A0A1Y1WTF6_9FUNG|nr:hypothetical protein BCR32DRAFT_283931 [Anaeromyces robustus]|eukprot:ORX76675.1 hypothetical protein BCR32DRAFT_283931 [Anaeromyces robustus]
MIHMTNQNIYELHYSSYGKDVLWNLNLIIIVYVYYIKSSTNNDRLHLVWNIFKDGQKPTFSFTESNFLLNKVAYNLKDAFLEIVF